MKPLGLAYVFCVTARDRDRSRRSLTQRGESARPSDGKSAGIERGRAGDRRCGASRATSP